LNSYFTGSSNKRTRSRTIRKNKKARSKDKDIVRVVEEIKKTKVKKLRGDE